MNKLAQVSALSVSRTAGSPCMCTYVYAHVCNVHRSSQQVFGLSKLSRSYVTSTECPVVLNHAGHRNCRVWVCVCIAAALTSRAVCSVCQLTMSHEVGPMAMSRLTASHCEPVPASARCSATTARLTHHLYLRVQPRGSSIMCSHACRVSLPRRRDYTRRSSISLQVPQLYLLVAKSNRELI